MPLPAETLAFDIDTSTGVLAAILAKRGVSRVIATENDARAIACARENIRRLGYVKKVEVVEAELFPEGRTPLIVCIRRGFRQRRAYRLNARFTIRAAAC